MGWEVVEVLCVVDVSAYQVRARRPGFEALKRCVGGPRPGSRGRRFAGFVAWNRRRGIESVGQVFPTTFEVDRAERIANWRPVVQWLLAIPHFL
jgi:hypothetical protein